MTVAIPTDLPVKHFRNAATWEKWLTAHVTDKGVWMQFAKKGQGVISVSYADALDVALCHGWIDGQLKSMDAQFYQQRFTPRRAKSIWSKINIGKVERLVAEGRMQASGLREVEAAKTDGRWDMASYDSAGTMQPHEDLLAALKKNKKARAFFDELDKTNRYAFCERVQTAKSRRRAWHALRNWRRCWPRAKRFIAQKLERSQENPVGAPHGRDEAFPVRPSRPWGAPTKGHRQ